MIKDKDMWLTLTIAFVILLGSGYLFFTASDRRSRVLEGLIALGSMMVCLAVAPFGLKLLLLASMFTIERWRMRWEKAQSNS